jgi:prepilin-type N-terminal cleavage/methylation domain-containing protein
MDISPCGLYQGGPFSGKSLPKSMDPTRSNPRPANVRSAFTLVELLVVIAIISVLMTAGSIGLSGLGGKGVTSGVATSESLFDEARSIAVGKNLRTCVLVAKKLTNNSADDLRRIVLATEPVDANGKPTTAVGAQPAWVLSTRGALLPEQTFFSAKFSKKNHTSGGTLDTVTLGNSVKQSYRGDYFIYEFNSQGISAVPGSSFVIGSGTRRLSGPGDTQPPRVTGGGTRDFGGFVIWRNGSTSVFRNPDQIGVGNLNAGDTF